MPARRPSSGSRSTRSSCSPRRSSSFGRKTDRGAFVWVVEHRVGWLDPVFVALSVVGYAGLVWIALAPALAIWAKRGVVATTALTAACVWVSDLTALAVKLIVGRPRPFAQVPEADPLLGGTLGSSFPSGHAATALAGAVILAVLVRRAIPALFALAALISFSRVYIGVHYPLDVLGGAAIGAAVGLAFAYALRVLPRPLGAPRRSAAARPRG
jgi:undecaprenyl-diphosphatase